MAYTPKTWVTGEIIKQDELNHMEKGIADAHSALDEAVNKASEVSNTAVENIQAIQTQINSDLGKIQSEISGYKTEINNSVKKQNDALTANIAAALGTDYYKDNAWVNMGDSDDEEIISAQKDVTNRFDILFNQLGLDKDSAVYPRNTIGAQITLINNYLGINSDSSTGETLEEKIYNNIGPILGNLYYTSNSTPALGTNNKSIDARISEIYVGVFGENGSSGSSLKDQIQNLNKAIFGSGEGGDSEVPLIDKIENALGRELEPTEQQIANNPNKGSSLLALIEQIQGILGINGQTSSDESDLVTKINNICQAVYGTTSPTVDNISTFTTSLATLFGDFYNIEVEDDTTKEKITGTKKIIELMYPKLSQIESTNVKLEGQVKDFADAAARAIDAYIDASSTTIDGNEYLVLKRDVQEDVPQSEQDLEDNKDKLLNTYIVLPKGGGGGGGGATYEYYSVFEVDRTDNSPTVTQEDSDYTIKYRWATKRTADGSNSSGLPGTLQVYNNNVLVYSTSVTSGESTPEGSTPVYSEIYVGDYITLGSNVFRIVVSGSGVATSNFYYTIRCINPVLTSTFNPSSIQTGNSIVYQFIMSVGDNTVNKVLHVAIDGTEIRGLSPYSSTSERLQTVSFSTPSNGAHLLEVWFTMNINNAIVTSNVLRYGIICGDLTQTYISADLKSNTRVSQYNNLIVNYLARTPNQINTVVDISVTDKNPAATNNFTIYATLEETVQTDYNRWTYQLNIPIAENIDEVTLYLSLVANKDTSTRVVVPFILVKNTRYNFSPITSGLQLYLNADQHSNTSSDRAVWTNSTTETVDEDVKNISATLSNFLFYREVDGWQRDSDNKYFLRLRNKARVEIPFSVFNFKRDTSNNITDGMTFEIEFKTGDVVNYNTVCIACGEASDLNSGTISRGIELTPQSSRFQVATTSSTVSTGTDKKDQHVDELTATNLLYAYYKEEEKITLDFVINKTIMDTNNNENPKEAALMYIYINGILSGATPYTSFENFQNGKIIIGSDQCTTDIYSIRCYSQALDYHGVLQNWISNEGNLETRTELYNKNTYNSTTDTGLFAEFLEKSPTTPYMVIMANGDLNDPTIMPTQKGSENARPADFCFVDPLNPSNNIEAISTADLVIPEKLSSYSGAGSMQVQVQGTSSQYYYRKNYKLKFTSFTQNGILHKSKKALTDDDYNIEYGEDNEVISKTLKTGLSKDGYKLSSTSYPTWTFCIKADVASSESANNTRLTMLYDELSRNYYMTPPQEQNPSIRQGVEGRPVVVWYYNVVDMSYTLLGKYNFNNDKGTSEVFGLEGDENTPWELDQSWEIKNNGTSPLTLFNYSDSEWNKWYNAFEARFPDQDDAAEALSGAKDITGVSQEDQNKWTAGLKEAVKWVSDHVELIPSTDPENRPDSEAQIIGYSSITDFRKDFEKYFNIKAMTFFYVFTEFFLMVDNRAKNMFLTRYFVNDDRPTIYGANTLTKDGSTNQQYFGWFSFPYDFDTGIGIDNNGRIRFDYHYESTDLQPDGTSVVFNGQHSKLWKAFEKAYGQEIANQYTSLGSRMTYDSVEKLFENHQSVWSEAIFNEDMFHKYIEWGNAYLYMLLGSKESHRKWWLSNRFRYFNSKYQVGKNDDRIYLRVAPGDYSLNVSTYADSYVNIEIGANASPLTVRALRGATKSLSYTASESDSTTSKTGIDGVETIIYPASSLNTLEGLAALAINEANFEQANKLETLKLGSPNPALVNTKLQSIALGNNAVLRHFDMRNYSAYSTAIDLSKYISLETAYLSGTIMPTVILPDGGVLTTIQYPTTTTTLKIKNQPYLTNLIIGNALPENERTDEDKTYDVPIFEGSSTNNYNNITQVYLTNIGTEFDSLNLVTRMGGTTNPSSLYLHLEDVVWESEASAFQTLYEKKLSKMKGYNTQEAISDEESAYISGTLTLTGSYDSDFINEIANAYQGRLQIYYQEDDELKKFHAVKFYRSRMAPNPEKTEFVATGNTARYLVSTLFTEDYITEYNLSLSPSLPNGSEYRWSARNWEWEVNGTTYYNDQVENVDQDLVVYPYLEKQYCLNQIIQKEDYSSQTIYSYFYPNVEITVLSSDSYKFVRDYYLYSIQDWTLDDSIDYTTAPSIQEGDTRTPISGRMGKSESREIIYARYSRSPNSYTINIYNTDINGNPTTELLGNPLHRYAVGTGATTIKRADVLAQIIEKGYASTDDLTISGATASNSVSQYHFNNWKPYIPSDDKGLTVTGDMNIYATYYNEKDIFNCYFLNKLTNCDLITLGVQAGNKTITKLPAGAFNQNTNLMALRTAVTEVGDASFSNFSYDRGSNSDKRLLIFTGNNVSFGRDCFYSVRDCVIIFTGTGQIQVDLRSFNSAQRCYIVVLNSNLPIICATQTERQSSFSSFAATSNNNTLFVTESAYNKYVTNSAVPSAFLDNSQQSGIANCVQKYNVNADAIKEINQIVSNAGYTL